MLELKGIRKDYDKSYGKVAALDDINISFRTKEFVVILGASGSGKTTFLETIAGITTPTCGEILYRGNTTLNFSSAEWDAYRNQTIGYFSQKNFLLPEKTVLENLTLPLEAFNKHEGDPNEVGLQMLVRLGMENYAFCYPRELPYGQQRKLCLARALINNPDILLCDEPTGTLNSDMSDELLDFIKEEAKNRLVIIVSHEWEQVRRDADRFIYLVDGQIKEDSRPFHPQPVSKPFQTKSSAMSMSSIFSGVISLFRGRKKDMLRSVGGCCLGVAAFFIALSILGGFGSISSEYESRMMEKYPIIITSGDIQVKAETVVEEDGTEKYEEYTEEKSVYPYDLKLDYENHDNRITADFVEYIRNIDGEYCQEIEYIQRAAMNLLRVKEDGSIIPVSIAPAGSISDTVVSANDLSLATVPETINDSKEMDTDTYIKSNYDLLYGIYPTDVTDLCLVVDSRNRLDSSVLTSLGYDITDVQSVDFGDLVGQELIMVSNDDYYTIGAGGLFTPRTDYDQLAQCEDNVTLKIVGIIRPKEEVSRAILRNGIIYKNELCTLCAQRATSSRIVAAQRGQATNVLTGEELDDNGKKWVIAAVGGDLQPSSIILYSDNLKNKKEIASYIEAYNERGTSSTERIIYKDLATEDVSIMGSMMESVYLGTGILVIITGIICIILIFVLAGFTIRRRRKNIGIHRMLGIRGSDIRKINMIWMGVTGLCIGILGCLLGILIVIPTDLLISRILSAEQVIPIRYVYILISLVFSVVVSLAVQGIQIRKYQGEEICNLVYDRE